MINKYMSGQFDFIPKFISRHSHLIREGRHSQERLSTQAAWKLGDSVAEGLNGWTPALGSKYVHIFFWTNIQTQSGRWTLRKFEISNMTCEPAIYWLMLISRHRLRALEVSSSSQMISWLWDSSKKDGTFESNKLGRIGFTCYFPVI